MCVFFKSICNETPSKNVFPIFLNDKENKGGFDDLRFRKEGLQSRSGTPPQNGESFARDRHSRGSLKGLRNKRDKRVLRIQGTSSILRDVKGN